MSSEASYPTAFRLTVVLTSLFFGTFLVAIDTTIVSVAIPKISSQFHALDDVGWYGSAYLITTTALQPAAGTLYRLFDAKTVYLAAIVVFEAGSALCAAAPTSQVFILGRAVGASGAALLIQGAISVITHISPLEKRPLYIGLVVSCFGICASFSPVIGGALTDKVSWRWCFWINLPIGGLIFFLVMLGLRLKIERHPMRSQSLRDKLKQLDPLGIIVLLGGVSCLFLALQWGGISYRWTSSKIVGLLTGSGVLFILFGFLQWWLGERATIPPRMLKHRTVLYGALSLFFISMSSNIKLYYLPFFFQAVLGGSALRSGVDFLTLSIPQVIATVVAGSLTTKYGHYVWTLAMLYVRDMADSIRKQFPIMLTGTIVCSVGTGLLIRIRNSTPTEVWAIFMVIAGFGDGLCTNMPYTAIQAILDAEADVFIGNAIATFATLAGGAIGIATGETILVSKLLNEVPKYTTSVAPQAVISSGALNLSTLTDSPSALDGLRQAYGRAISTIMLYATVAVCIANLTTLGMKPLNLKTVSREREIEKADFQASSSHQEVAASEDKCEAEDTVALK